MSELSIANKHKDMIQYAEIPLNNMSKRHRVYADTIRKEMLDIWVLIARQQWSRNRLELLLKIDEEINALKSMVRLVNDLKYFQGAHDDDGKCKIYYVWSSYLVEEGRMVGAMINSARKGARG